MHTNAPGAAVGRNQIILVEPRKARKGTKIQSTEYTEYTDFFTTKHSKHSKKPHRRADNGLKDLLIEQNVDHEWFKRLRRLGGCLKNTNAPYELSCLQKVLREKNSCKIFAKKQENER